MPIPRFLKEMHSTFILHAVASHFSNGLIPVAVLFMVLSLTTANPYFEHTVLHLLIVSFCIIPVSFISGIRDWQIKFHGRRAPIFQRKIMLSIMLLLLGGFALALRLSHPDVLSGQGTALYLYVGSLFLMLPIVILLGHLGGKLIFPSRKME
jgi:hypothetical protein